jgi:hypothetical protein
VLLFVATLSIVTTLLSYRFQCRCAAQDPQQAGVHQDCHGNVSHLPIDLLCLQQDGDRDVGEHTTHQAKRFQLDQLSQPHRPLRFFGGERHVTVTQPRYRLFTFGGMDDTPHRDRVRSSAQPAVDPLGI